MPNRKSPAGRKALPVLVLHKSGRPDSNRGPPAPKAGALPSCATPRKLLCHNVLHESPERRNYKNCAKDCVSGRPFVSEHLPVKQRRLTCPTAAPTRRSEGRSTHRRQAGRSVQQSNPMEVRYPQLADYCLVATLPGSSASVLQAPRDPVDGGEERITQWTIGAPLIAPAAEQVDLENVHRVHVGIPQSDRPLQGRVRL